MRGVEHARQGISRGKTCAGPQVQHPSVHVISMHAGHSMPDGLLPWRLALRILHLQISVLSQGLQFQPGFKASVAAYLNSCHVRLQGTQSSPAAL